MKITLNLSPNFDPKKRKLNQIKFIIFHYTGMKHENKAIDKLTNFKSKVSCHYFIKINGDVIKMVPEIYSAWHAGISGWKKYKSLNKYSLGIEISNPGHQYKYNKFSQIQIKSLLKLTKYLLKKYKIDSKSILGHSDIAPYRKKDPGEKFPWRFLSKKRIGIWHSLNSIILKEERNIKITNLLKKKFINNLYKIGYARNQKLDKTRYSKMLTIAFQRRFRQELINGIIDKECFKISENLLKKIK